MISLRLDYIELPAPDLEATKAFYADAFGWTFVDYGPAYAACDTGTVEIALNAQGTPAPLQTTGAEDGNGPLVLFRTDDIAAAQDVVVGAGGEIVSPDYAYPGGRRLHVRDPSGNVVGIYQPST
jgi:predicted enzyme related to lactoylglutathione lyase